jgi:mRNA interferase RelE/StbE
MASYSVRFKPSAEKDLRKLPKAMISRVIEEIEQLRSNPFPRQAIKLESVERLYRVRVGDFRIIYSVETELQQITIFYIRNRREVYRNL